MCPFLTVVDSLVLGHGSGSPYGRVVGPEVSIDDQTSVEDEGRAVDGLEGIVVDTLVVVQDQHLYRGGGVMWESVDEFQFLIQ